MSGSLLVGTSCVLMSDGLRSQRFELKEDDFCIKDTVVDNEIERKTSRLAKAV